MTVLVTGATGYIGGRLTSRLVERGVPVRLLVRDPRRIHGRWWEHDVEVVTGDLFDPASLARALDGAEQAYYLVHSMTHAADFAERDRVAARNFVQAGRELKHCIYLGGLVPETRDARAEAKQAPSCAAGSPPPSFGPDLSWARGQRRSKWCGIWPSGCRS